jgi:hypothetical protein
MSGSSSGNMKKYTNHSGKGNSLSLITFIKAILPQSGFKRDSKMAGNLSTTVGSTSPQLQSASCLLSFDIKMMKESYRRWLY